MDRIPNPLTCLMIALLAIAGTAAAGVNLGAEGSAYATSDHARVAGHAAGNAAVSDDHRTSVGLGDGSTARARASASADGDVDLVANGHRMGADVDASGRASATFEGKTVSTGDVKVTPPPAPTVPRAGVSLQATVQGMASAMGSLVASFTAAIAGAFR